MSHTTRLSPAELSMLDAMITYAEQTGLNFDDALDEPECEEHVTDAAAETVEARHDGVFRMFMEHNRAVVKRVEALTRELGDAPTLGQLLELRGQAVRET